MKQAKYAEVAEKGNFLSISLKIDITVMKVTSKIVKINIVRKKYNENIEINRLKRKLTNYKYRQENTEQYKRVQKKYSQSEKGKEALFRGNVKRRSYKHKISFTPFQRKQILDRDKWTCQNCGIKVHDRSTGDGIHQTRPI